MFDFESQRVVARTDRLLVEEFGDELVIYDLDTDTAHLLNETSRRVYQRALQAASAAELVALFPELSRDEAHDLVLAAVSELQAAGLVLATLPDGLTRRRFLRAAATAAVAAPAVISILAPTPAMATGTGTGTCTLSHGSTCTVGAAPPNCCVTGEACTAPVGGGQSKCCVTGSTDTKSNNQSCTSSAQCCSGNCDTGAGKCVGS